MMNIPPVMRGHGFAERLGLSILGVAFLSLPTGSLASQPEPGRPVTVLGSTIYETTPWAVTDILPGGNNTPFTGIPIPEMHGADSVAVILEDFVIPELNHPVEVPIELIALNERNIEPLKLGEDEYDFYFTLNPAKRSLGKLTVVQTKPDDGGPDADGYFLRQTELNLLAIMVPRQRGKVTVTEASITIASPVPIPFSFDPSKDMVVVRSEVGDMKANWHVDKGSEERDFFIGEGLLQVPLGGNPLFDSRGGHTARGGSVRALRIDDILRDVDGMPEIKPNVNFMSAKNGVPAFYDSTLVGEDDIQSTDISVHYFAKSGEWKVHAPPETRLTAVNLTSSTGIFVGGNPSNLDGPLDEVTPIRVFKLAIGEAFDQLDLGVLTSPGLSMETILHDVTARVMLSDGSQLSRIRLVYEDGDRY